MKLTKIVLVTGGTGFIGRQSLAPLLERGYEVHALYLKEPVEADPRVVWHKADLLQTEAAAQLCAAVQPTHLLHFAWYVNPKDYKNSPENNTWVQATLALLQAFTENGGARAVMAGTCMEYDWTIPQDVLSEATSPIKPATLYGACKTETRLAAESYAAQNGVELAWGRIFYLYGPHEAPPRLVPDVINSILAGRPALCSTGEQVRDYSYVGDIAEAFCALLDSFATGPVNIGSGVPSTLKEIILTIADTLGKRDLVHLGARPAPVNEPSRIVADVTRLREEVGWSPRYDLHKGLQETIRWWKAGA